jgi:hypothetical protein
MNSVALLEYQQQYGDQKYTSGVFMTEARQWYYVICLPVIGLLVLYYFLSLGGIFALLGPWVIFFAVRLLTKLWDEPFTLL